MHRVVLLTGTNLGDKSENLNKAAESIKANIGPIIAGSEIYRSEPWGFESNEDFLNQAIVVETSLSPQEVLSAVLSIESELGRVRSAASPEEKTVRKYESRVIDIDILFYDDIIINTENLVIPHPLICEREFVLTPLKEIIGDFIHPVNGKKISDL